MKRKIQLFFVYSAGAILLATALAKLVSSAGNAHILEMADPIFTISFRRVFCIVAVLELLIAFVCFLGKQIGLKAILLAWLATMFFVYRGGLVWLGYKKPCSCLGNLSDSLHIPPQAADTAMKIMLAYLLIGSYAILFWLWNEKRMLLVMQNRQKKHQSPHHSS